jgi:1-deoxy-D-xylulose-5-phosphate synthase
VINARFAKPIDTALLELFSQNADVIVTFEDHVIQGGFGSAILEELSNKGIVTPVVRIGWPDEFIDHGKPDDLRIRYGLSVKAAKEKLLPHLAKIKGTVRKTQPAAA